MAGKKGITETKELLKFVIELVKAVDASVQDGEFSFSDVVNFVSALLAASDGLIGVEEVPSEIVDFQPEEVHELQQYIKDELVLSNPKYEKFLEDALEIGVKLYDLIQMTLPPKPEEPETPPAA